MKYSIIPCTSEVKVSNSLITTLQFCKRKFLLSYLFRLTPHITPKQFIYGTNFGLGLDEFYEKGSIKVEGIIDLYYAELDKMVHFMDDTGYDDYNKQAMILAGALDGYQKYYEDDFEKYEYVAHEKEFSFPVLATGDRDYYYSGKMDLLLKLIKTGEMILTEHETAAQVTYGYINKLALDTQVTGYIKGALSEGYDCKRILYNVTGKCKLRQKQNESVNEYRNRVIDDYVNNPDKYFIREDLHRSSAELQSFEDELSEKIVDLDVLLMVADDYNPKTDLKYFYKTESNCNSPYGLCPFFKVCAGTGGFDCNEIDNSFYVRDKFHNELKKE